MARTCDERDPSVFQETLWFQPGSDTWDFEAFRNLPDWWNATQEEHDEMFVRFKAYSTHGEFTAKEVELRRAGYEFDCYVDLQCENTDSDIFEQWELANFPANDRREAQRLLNLAAEALYR